MRRFFSHEAPVVGAETVIAGQDARHIVRVLRLKAGDEVVLLSGDGREFQAKIARIDAGNVAVAVLSERVSGADPSIELTICLGFLKEKKMDDLVRQLTELGMSRFQPFLARRSVSRPDPSRMASRVRRWEKIARESIKQCRRGSVPEIRPAVSLDEALRLSADDGVKILFYENETGPNSFPESRSAGADVPLKVTIMLGPEGGFTDDEVGTVRSAGFEILSMGPRILKAETAAVAACALVQYVYGDMGNAEVGGQRPEVRGQRTEKQESQIQGL
jgi:16S rRNA (uracil1498-N3)-methyltransferase